MHFSSFWLSRIFFCFSLFLLMGIGCTTRTETSSTYINRPTAEENTYNASYDSFLDGTYNRVYACHTNKETCDYIDVTIYEGRISWALYEGVRLSAEQSSCTEIGCTFTDQFERKWSFDF